MKEKFAHYLGLLAIICFLITVAFSFANVLRKERSDREYFEKLQIENLKLQIELKKIELKKQP
jgi:hypothetical protein